jgi:hypothetical protein
VCRDGGAGEAGEPGGQRGGGRSGVDDGECPGRGEQAGDRVVQVRGTGREADRVGRRVQQRAQAEQPHDPSGPREGGRQRARRLRRRGDRDDEEGRGPVHRDQLSGADRAGHGQPGPEPGDDDEDRAGQQHLGSGEPGDAARDEDPGGPDAGRRLAGSRHEPSLAADPAEDPQPGHDVGGQRVHRGQLLALVVEVALQRREQR